MRFGLIGTLVLLGCSATGRPTSIDGRTAAANLRQPTEPSPDGWSAVERVEPPTQFRKDADFDSDVMPGLYRESAVFFYLKKQGATWKAVDTADVRDPEIEQVILTERYGKQVKLAAEPQEEQSRGGVGTYQYWCRGGKSPPTTRGPDGYTVCNSAFTVDLYQDAQYGHMVRVDGAALMRAVRAAGLIEGYAQALAQRKEAAVAAARQSDQRTKEFRQHLEIGQTTHCGLVVEIKRPVVKLQTTAGEHWLKIDQIFPEGATPCR